MIKDMQPLQGQALIAFQEELKYIKYIIIDEMSFLGPKLLLKIVSRLREALPHRKYVHFGGVSVIFFGDLAQLPLVMDKWIYTSNLTTKLIWDQFTIVATLQTIFQQERETTTQDFFFSFYAIYEKQTLHKMIRRS